PTVGLEHIAVEGDGVLPHRFEVDDCTQRTSDEAGDLVSAASDLAFDRLTSTSGVSSPRQHGVFGGDPAFPGAAAPAGDALFHGCSTEHACLTRSEEHTSELQSRE